MERKVKRRIAFLAILALIIFVSIAYILVKAIYNGSESGTTEGFVLVNGAYQRQLDDFGPGSIKIDATKVVGFWEKKEPFTVKLLDEAGEVLTYSQGIFQKEMEGRDDGVHSDYYVMKETFQVLFRGDYRLVIEGMRKGSRDSIKVTFTHQYSLTKGDFKFINGSYVKTFHDDEPISLHVSAVKSFPSGETRSNIEAEVMDEEGHYIDRCKGYFIEGESAADVIDEDDDDDWYDDDDYGDSDYNDWGLSLWIYALMNYKEDYYVLENEFMLSEQNNMTLRIRGLRINSGDELAVTARGRPYSIGPAEVKEQRTFQSDLLTVLTRPLSILLAVLSLSFAILFILIFALRTYMRG